MPTTSTTAVPPLTTPPLSRGELAAIAYRVESAIAGSHKELTAVHDELLGQVRLRMREAGGHSTMNTPEFEAAYQLGQLSFAQHLVAQALCKRAEDNFFPALQSPRYSPYVTVLAEGQKTSQALAAALDSDEASVRAVLEEMRELGIAEFARQGEDLVNFLTPLAIAGRLQGARERK